MSLLQKMKEIRSRLTLVKDATNPHFGNDYVSLDAVLSALNPLLDEYNMHLEQSPRIEAGLPTIRTRIYDLDHVVPGDAETEPFTYRRHAVRESEYCESFWPLVIDANPQKAASASTYARRYSLLCMFALTASDDDGEAATGRGGGHQVPKGVKAALKRLG